jgi:hypothetical protein
MYYISVPLSVRTPQAQRRYVLYICAIIIENTSSTEMVCIIYMCHYQCEHLKHGDGMYYISVPLSVRTPQARRWYVLYICAIISENTSITEMVCIIYMCHYQWEHLKHGDGMYYIHTRSQRGFVRTPPWKQISTIQVDVLFKLWLLKSRFCLNCDY